MKCSKSSLANYFVERNNDKVQNEIINDAPKFRFSPPAKMYTKNENI